MEGWASMQKMPSLSVILLITILALSLPYSEHFGSAYGAYALSGRPAILHDYASGILHFPFGAAFHTVCLHQFTSLFFKG
jgi:hypothetical protein